MIQSKEEMTRLSVYRNILFVVLLSIYSCLSCVFAQNKKVGDSTYFISYPDKIVIKANVDTQTDTYILREAYDNSKFEIVPNNEYRVFLSFDYKFVGFSFGFTPKFFSPNNDESLKGTSSFSDYRFQFYFEKFVQELRYRKIKGYYVVNSDDFILDWQEGQDPYIQFPDLKNTLWGMSTSYVLNDKFSYRNLNNPTQWQRKSAGSLVPTLHYNYFYFSNKFLNEKSEEHDFNIRLALSYYYTLVLNEKWFFTPNITPSAGIRFSNYKDIDAGGVTTREKNTLLTRSVSGGLQLGFNTSRVFAGANFNFNVNWYNEENNARVENDQVYGLFYVGYRFGAPEFLERFFKKAEDKMHEEMESLKIHKTDK
jgi:hypothetical protein